MAIFGSGPADSSSGSSGVCVVMILISDRIEESIGDLHKAKEPGMMGYVACLRVLAQRFPPEADLTLRKATVERWRTRFFEWFDDVEAKLPAQFCGGMREQFQTEFTELAELLS
jgi:hypothetical protein